MTTVRISGDGDGIARGETVQGHGSRISIQMRDAKILYGCYWVHMYSFDPEELRFGGSDCLGGEIGVAGGATGAWNFFLLQVPIGVSDVFVPPIIRWAIGNPIRQNSEGEWIQDG